MCIICTGKSRSRFKVLVFHIYWPKRKFSRKIGTHWCLLTSPTNYFLRYFCFSTSLERGRITLSCFQGFSEQFFGERMGRQCDTPYFNRKSLKLMFLLARLEGVFIFIIDSDYPRKRNFAFRLYLFFMLFLQFMRYF